MVWPWLLLLCLLSPVSFASVLNGHKIGLKSVHIPDTIIGGPATRKTLAIPAKFYSAHLLIGNISVGTPEQTFQVAFQLDTTSSYLIGPEAELLDGIEKHRFNPDNSSTYKSEWTDFTNEDQDVFGQLGTDLAKFDNLSATKFAFGVAQYVPYYVQRNAIDGEMGLAPRWDSRNGVKSLLMQLSQNLEPDQWLLSVRIRPHMDVEDASQVPFDSALTIGAKDTENCDSRLHYVDQLYAEEGWHVRLSFVSVDGHKAKLGNDTTGGEVVELNRHLRINYGPKRWVLRMAFAIGGQFDDSANLFAISCHSTANLTFGLGERNNEWAWTMGPKDYIYQPEQDGTCFLAFYPVDVGDWGFGPQFYEKNCVTLNFAEMLIGFSAPLEGH